MKKLYGIAYEYYDTDGKYHDGLEYRVFGSAQKAYDAIADSFMRNGYDQYEDLEVVYEPLFGTVTLRNTKTLKLKERDKVVELVYIP